MSNKTKANAYKDMMDKIVELSKGGNICFMAFDGSIMVAEKNNFISQPAGGILYDLNRGEEVVGTFAKDNIKWVNDYAVAKTIRALKEQLATRDALIERLVEVGDVMHKMLNVDAVNLESEVDDAQWEWDNIVCEYRASKDGGGK